MGRDLVGYPVFPDRRFSPGDAFLHRLDGDEEGPGNFLGGQAAHLAQGKGNPRVDGQRWVATREYEPELVVLDDVSVPFLGYGVGPVAFPGHLENELAPSLPADCVD